MVTRQIEEEAANVLGKAAPWFSQFMKRFGWTITITSVLAVVGYLAVREYLRSTTRNVEFYIGSWTGTHRENARLIQEQAEEPVNGQRFKINVRGSGGFEENRRQVSHDQTGNEIGFVHEGFGDTSNLRMLLS